MQHLMGISEVVYARVHTHDGNTIAEEFCPQVIKPAKEPVRQPVGPRRRSLLVSERPPGKPKDLFLAFARLATAGTQDTGRHGGETSAHHRGRVDAGAR